MDAVWLAVGIGIMGVAFALAVRRDIREERQRKDRQRAAREIVFGSLKREPSAPIDFSEALRRRGRR